MAKRLVERFKETVLWTHVISILLSWFGWQGPVAAVLLSALGFGFGVTESIPPVILGMATFCFFVAVIWLFQIPAIAQAVNQLKSVTPRERPDPEIWRHVPELRLFEAACLLADTTPTFPAVSKPGDANGWYRALRHAVKAGEIPHVVTRNDSAHTFYTDQTTTRTYYEPYEETIITREALKDFAKKRNVVRAFLSAD